MSTSYVSPSSMINLGRIRILWSDTLSMENVIEILDDSSSEHVLNSSPDSSKIAEPSIYDVTDDHDISHNFKAQLTPIEANEMKNTHIASSPGNNNYDIIFPEDELSDTEQFGHKSEEISVPFVEDGNISNPLNIRSDEMEILEPPTKKLKKTQSILDKIDMEFNSSSSVGEIDLTDGLGELNTMDNDMVKIRHIINHTPHETFNDLNPPHKTPDVREPEEIIIVDASECSANLHNKEQSNATIPSKDIFKEFPLSSQKSVESINSLANKGAVTEGIDMISEVSSQVKQHRNVEHKEPVENNLNKKPSIKTKSNGNLSETVDLEIAMFLDDDIEASGIEASQPVENMTASQPNNGVKKPPIMPIFQRSNTTGFNDKITTNKQSDLHTSNLEKYIINGQEYTDEESEDMIRHFLKENKLAFKHVNQIYRDNQKARECIVIEMPKCLIQIFKNTNIDVEELIQPATLQVGYFDKLPVIKFFRQCDSIYDFSHDYYYPCEKKLIEENICILYYDAQDFFDKYANEKKKLYKSIRMYSKKGKQVILILNGINKFKRAIGTLEDRQYREKVNEHLLGSGSSPNKKKKSSRLESVKNIGMNAFNLEERIRFIDREWKVQIQTSNSTLEFIHSLPNLVSLIAKKRNDPLLRFMQYAYINVKSGKDQTDILRKTMHDIGKIPDLKAGSIVRTYPKFQELLNDFEKSELKSDFNGNHIMSESMEHRLYRLFTSDDPNEVVP